MQEEEQEASLDGAFRLLTRPCSPAMSLKTSPTGLKRKVAVLHASGAHRHSPLGCGLADLRDHAAALRRRRSWHGRRRIGAWGPVLAERGCEYADPNDSLPRDRILRHQHDVNPDVAWGARKQPATAPRRTGWTCGSWSARRTTDASQPSDPARGTWGHAWRPSGGCSGPSGGCGPSGSGYARATGASWRTACGEVNRRSSSKPVDKAGESA